MKINSKRIASLGTLVAIVSVVSLFITSPLVHAATSPGLGAADPFVILSSSYINTIGGTTLSGSLGYTTGPATAPTVNGSTHTADISYSQAGIDQASALSALNSQPCTFNFAPGAIDLATDTTHGTVGVYSPGVYCTTGAQSVGGGGTITLDGAGTYIFRSTGALTTSANSAVTLANGASACTVWWTPVQATTLGATSTFVGNAIDPAGITIGNNVNWVGKALAFGGTVTTTADTLSTSLCATPPTTGTGSPTTGNTSTGSTSNPTTPGFPNTGEGPMDSGFGTQSLWLVAIIAPILAIATITLSKRKKA